MPRTTFESDLGSAVARPRFHDIDDTFTGLLLAQPRKQQATNIDGTPKFYKKKEGQEDADPVFEWVYDFIHVSSSHEYNSRCHYCKLGKAPDPDAEDNGHRRLFASWKQHKAIQEAVSAAKNAQGKMELYGPLTLTYSGDDDDKKKPGQAAPRLYEAKYRIPTDDEVDQCDAFLAEHPLTPPKQEESKRLSIKDMNDLIP